MMGLLAGVLAQTCVSLLPMANAEVEWFRDGRPYARDVPVSVSSSERVYRRQEQNGRTAQRTVSCATTGGVTYLVDRVDGGANVRLPVALEVGATRTVNGAAVRRIAPPADAGNTRGSRWFTVSSPGIAVYGVAPRAGIFEIRTPASSGGFSVLRAIVRDPAPAQAAADAATAVAQAEADAQARQRALQDRITNLEITQRVLHDSIARLNRALDSATTVPQSTTEVRELIAVDVYVERGEYQSALDLLVEVERRLQAWSDSAGTRHRALDTVDARLHRVLAECAAAAAAPRSRGARGLRPVTCSIAGS